MKQNKTSSLKDEFKISNSSWMLKKYQKGQQSVNRLQRFAGASSKHDRCLDNLRPKRNKSLKF